MRSEYKTYLLPAAILLSLLGSAAYADDNDIDKLLDTPIKDLTKMEVTSVSKRAEKASEAAAAIFVITQEDIRRSGFNTVPEVLRMVPGVQVSRINSGWWAITSRGNADAFGNKLLVLIDGRSIYNPLFSGVLWEEQSTPLEDIERIEVIRGPGSTLYGANAVNGVINIITKSSKDTQGNLAVAGVGSYDKFDGLYQYGGKLKNTDTYRAYVSHYDQGASFQQDGSRAFDGFDMTRSGIRYDGVAANNSNFTVSSDVYQGDRDIPFTAIPTIALPGFTDGRETHDMYGGNIIGKYNRKLDNGSNIDLQAYYDFVGRDADIFDQKIQTLDLDGQQTIDLTQNHQFIWGLGYRMVYDEIQDSNVTTYNENYLATNLFSGFAQDKIQLIPEELFLTIGSKLEHNTFTGFEVEPNIRMTWLPTQTQTVWGAVTRAVRTPSVIERTQTQKIASIPTFSYVGVTPDEQFNSEKLVAYEIGYRNQLTKDLSLDVATYLNDYSDIRTFEPTNPASPDTLIAFTPENRGYGITKGIEISSNWQVTRDWNLAASYSYLDMNIKTDSDSSDTIAKSEDGRSPSNMFNIRSHFRFDEQWETDEALYYVDSIHGSLGDPHPVNDYVRFDARIGYKPTNGVELSLVGQNLLDNRHQEFGSAPYSQPAEIPRSVFGKVTFRF